MTSNRTATSLTSEFLTSYLRKGFCLPMNDYCPAASVTALAIAIAEGRSAEETELLASMFVQLGETLGTITAARALNEKRYGKCKEQ